MNRMEGKISECVCVCLCSVVCDWGGGVSVWVGVYTLCVVCLYMHADVLIFKGVEMSTVQTSSLRMTMSCEGYLRKSVYTQLICDCHLRFI